MKILVVGNGGREHALAWKAAQSPLAHQVYVAPGNAGTALEPNLKNIDIAASDIEGLLEFAIRENIDLTIVGPEVPLVAGIVDSFGKAGKKCFGPSAQSAQLEGSKAFCKDFMARHGIPTAAYETFTEVESALAYLEKVGAPIVIKADGLAAGKGVVVAFSKREAQNAIEDMLAGNAFGSAGHRVVIEEFLEGEEASFIVVADGLSAIPMASSQDHKARDDGDTGPNTGGMGAYSPAPVVTPAIHDAAMQQVILPTLQGMAADGSPYTGFLYAGLMISPDGKLKVLEFNCRFGDPETQPIMLRFQGDLVDLCLKALDGKLNETNIEWDPRPALGVVMAAGGYPDAYESDHPISGLGTPLAEGVKVFHAGTRQHGEDTLTAGGRVLCVTALGSSIKDAQTSAYAALHQIHWDGVYFRNDIGHKAITRKT